MIKIDDILIEFVRYNYLTIGFIIAALKAAAKQSKTTFDDSVLTLLSNLVGNIRGGSKKGSTPE